MTKREKQFLEAVEDAAEFYSTADEMSEITELTYQDGDLEGQFMCNISLSADVYDNSTIEAASTDRGDQPVSCTNIEYIVNVHSMPEEFTHLRERVIYIITNRLIDIYE